jgi:hypothetical protein
MDLRACIQKIESITGLQFPPILPVAKLDWHRFKATSVRPLCGASVSALLSLMATGAPAASALHRPLPSLYRFDCISRSKQQNPKSKAPAAGVEQKGLLSVPWHHLAWSREVVECPSSSILASLHASSLSFLSSSPLPRPSTCASECDGACVSTRRPCPQK